MKLLCFSWLKRYLFNKLNKHYGICDVISIIGNKHPKFYLKGEALTFGTKDINTAVHV